MMNRDGAYGENGLTVVCEASRIFRRSQGRILNALSTK